MYPEFIAIYAGLVVVIALLVAVLILLIKVLHTPYVSGIPKAALIYDLAPGQQILPLQLPERHLRCGHGTAVLPPHQGGQRQDQQQVPGRPSLVPQPGAAAAAGPAASAGKIVFCRHCAAEFDASQMVCPKCGTPR